MSCLMIGLLLSLLSHDERREREWVHGMFLECYYCEHVLTEVSMRNSCIMIMYVDTCTGRQDSSLLCQSEWTWGSC